MPKITLDDIASGFSSVGKINSNSDTLEDHLNNKVLYRDNPSGEANQMLNDLDMNSQRILNLPSATTSAEPVTYAQWLAAADTTIVANTTLSQEQTAASDGQALFTLSLITYTPGAKNLTVYRNGTKLPSSSYTETSTSSITLNATNAAAIKTGDEFEFIVNERNVSADTVPASNVTYTPAGAGVVASNVQTKLREYVSINDFSGTITEKIQAAVDTGGHVYLGDNSDSLVITDPITLTTNNQKIFGHRVQMSFDASYDTQGGTVLKMFEVQAVDNVEICGIDFDMTPPSTVTGGGSFGIRYLSGCNYGWVHHCSFKNQEKISLASVTSGSGSSDIIVDNCIFWADSLDYGGGAILHSGARCIASNNIIKDLADSYISLDDTSYSTCCDNICINTMLDGGVLRSVGTVIQVAQGSNNCTVENNLINGVSQRGIYVFDSIGSTQENIIIANNVINGGGVANAAATSTFIETDADSSKIDIHGNHLLNFSNTLSAAIGIRVRNRDVRVFDNNIDATGAARGISVTYDSTASEYIHVFDNQIKADTIGIYFTSGDYGNTMQLHCYDNQVQNATNGLQVDASNFLPKIYGNTFDSCTNKTAGTWQYNTYFNTYNSDNWSDHGIQENVILYQNAAPVSGTWKVGDRIWDTVPASGSVGWICTVAGTPGTWVSFG